MRVTSTVPDIPLEPELHRFLTLRLSRIQAKLNAQASHILREVNGLSLVQWRILALVAASGRSTASALSQYAGIDKGLFSRALKTLVAGGLISVATDPADHRSHVISATDRGFEIFERTLPIMRARQAHLVSDMTPEQRRVLMSALDKLEVAATRLDFT